MTVFSVGNNQKSADLQSWSKLKNQEKIFNNEWAQTGKSSKLEIKLRSKTTVSMKQETQIKIEAIDKNKNVVLKMVRGVIDNRVKPGSGKKYMVKCIAMNLSVRGTRFIVESDGKTDRVKVLKGKVAVSRNINGINTPETILNAGEEARVSVEENARIAYKLKLTTSYQHKQLLTIKPIKKAKILIKHKKKKETPKSKSRNRTLY